MHTKVVLASIEGMGVDDSEESQLEEAIELRAFTFARKIHYIPINYRIGLTRHLDS